MKDQVPFENPGIFLRIVYKDGSIIGSNKFSGEQTRFVQEGFPEKEQGNTK